MLKKNGILFLAVAIVAATGAALFGALSTPISPSIPALRGPAVMMTPVSPMTNWQTICDAPTTSDNSGSTVVNPGGITRSAQRLYKMSGKGTTVLIRLKYPTAGTVSTAPVIQAFGLDENSIPERLFDGASTPAHALTLTADTSNDARDGTYSYTQPVEVDVKGNQSVMVAVKTALAGSSLTGAVILIKNN